MKVFSFPRFLRQFNFTVAKGTIEGGKSYDEDTEIRGGRGEEAMNTNYTRTLMDN